jgi:hypothetical protein
MKFSYLKGEFLGEGLDIVINGTITLRVKDGELVLKDWREVRELMYKMEEINKEAAITKKRQHYGTDLVLYLDEGKWKLWFKKKEISISDIMLRELPIILRYFLKKYHKIMLDFGSCVLKEGFEIDTNNNSYKETLEFRGL